jgi:cellobiose phosphorylase
MYRLFVESLLGVQREGERLHLSPRLPADWPQFTMHYRFRDTVYHITVTRAPAGEPTSCVVNGATSPDGWISLLDDHQDHRIALAVGAAAR